jgi:predicted dehydrogenase
MPGGGAIYDLGAHLIDQTVLLFGLPKRVTAFLGNQREGVSGSDDSFTVLMHYDGFLATAKAAVVSPQEKQLRFWVKGTEGTFKKVYGGSTYACASADFDTLVSL